MKALKERVKLIVDTLGRLIVTDCQEVTGLRDLPCGYKKPGGLPDVLSPGWREFSSGGYWGGESDMHAWFTADVIVPPKFVGKTVRLCVDTQRSGWDLKNPQFMLFIDGVLQQAFDVNHRSFLLPEGCTNFHMDLYAYTSQYVSDQMRLFVELREIDTETEELYYDLNVPLQILEYTDSDDIAYIELLKGLNQAVDALDLRRLGSKEYKESVKLALKKVHDTIYGKLKGKSEISAVCIGHTHIDIAWLWTLVQTREKVVRTFSTVVNYMKQYPEYRFMSSQAYLYNVVKEDAPELFAQIRELIRQGRWEVEGAMWVEADCNISGGESLVRQILYGKRFFQKEFGVDCKILWLPDVFGYSAALPQILKKSGVDSFLTSKISWNDTNRVPYDLFYWKGIDGSEVLTYFLCTQEKKLGEKPQTQTLYVGFAIPKQIAGSWDRFQQKELANETLVTYGYGDGGGGPTLEHLENLRRMAYGLPGCPRTVQEPAGNFFRRMHERSLHSVFPKWVGELYLEFHRGTYTTMSRNKRFNRKSEFLMWELELLQSINQGLLGERYQQTEIRKFWDTIMVNQFHDIVPGSAIREVYEDSLRQYLELTEQATHLLNESMQNLLKQVQTSGGYLVFNPHSFENSDVVVAEDGFEFFAEDIPPKGYAVVRPASDRVSSVVLGEKKIENARFCLAFNDCYELISIYDKKFARELIPEKSRANILRVFEEPMHDEYDAWELREYYREKYWDVVDLQKVESVRTAESAGFCIVRRFLDSTITQTIRLYDRLDRIDFDTKVDWKERHLLLKALFPLDINQSVATYDIQFGNVQRNTHVNTSWDQAKYEVCAHKFADLSEGGYGVALLNDCKYGYDVHDGVLGLSLLRSPTYPNPDADREEHTFRYSLYPHNGGFTQSGTVREAYRFNLKMTAFPVMKQKGKLPERFSLVTCDSEQIIMETVKKAEDSDAIVLRMYETANTRGVAILHFGIPVQSVKLCNLLEECIEELTVQENTVQVTYSPYEIITLMVK